MNDSDEVLQKKFNFPLTFLNTRLLFIGVRGKGKGDSRKFPSTNYATLSRREFEQLSRSVRRRIAVWLIIRARRITVTRFQHGWRVKARSRNWYRVTSTRYAETTFRGIALSFSRPAEFARLAFAYVHFTTSKVSSVLRLRNERSVSRANECFIANMVPGSARRGNHERITWNVNISQLEVQLSFFLFWS